MERITYPGDYCKDIALCDNDCGYRCPSYNGRVGGATGSRTLNQVGSSTQLAELAATNTLGNVVVAI